MTENIIYINDNCLKKGEHELKNYLVRSSLTSFSQETKRTGLTLKYVLNGTEGYRIDGEKRTLNSGQFLISNCGQELACHFDEDKPVQGLCMYIDENLIKQRISEASLTEDQLLDGGTILTELPEFRDFVYTAGYRALGHFAANTANSIDKLSDLGTGAFFHVLADEMVKHNRTDNKKVSLFPGTKNSTKEEIHRRITTCINFIYAHYDKDLSIGELAKISNMSEFHFLRSFKSGLGITPHKFINLLRLEKAAELLASSAILVNEIGFEVGYNDASSFGRVFKRHFSITPVEYRKKLA